MSITSFNPHTSVAPLEARRSGTLGTWCCVVDLLARTRSRVTLYPSELCPNMAWEPAGDQRNTLGARVYFHLTVLS